MRLISATPFRLASTMNPYKILGINETASDEELKRAYRAMAAKYHPDAGGDAWAFEQVREAYDRIIRARKGQHPPNASREAKQPETRTQPTAPPPAPQMTAQSTGRDAWSGYPIESEASGNVQSLSQRVFTLLFRHQLPLQSETNFFILANVLDIVFTNILLRMNAIEANPIANQVFIHWGFNGMIAFKLFLVACVCLITQLIAIQHLRRARQTLYLGTAIVGVTVAYSALLLTRV